MDEFYLRKARIPDVERMHALLLENSKRGLLLPRSYNQLYGYLRDYWVLADRETDKAWGCCAMSISWKELGEIRSLAVDDSLQRKGHGRRLVNVCLEEGRELGLRTVFTLTFVTDFFAGLGFRHVEKDYLPQKVWVDCVNCPHFPNCGEEAMVLELES